MGSEGGLVDDIRGSWLCKLLVIPMLASLAWHTFKQALRADLLLVQWIPTAVVALPAKLFLRRPMILHSRTYPDTPFWRMVYRFLLPFADGVIYNSNDNHRLTGELYTHRNTTVIGSGINLKQFAPPANARRENEVWELITVARLVEFKGLEFAIRAVAELKKRGRKARLSIAGDGPLRAELGSLASELGVADEVVFCGALPHDRIPEKMWASDLFLISSIVDSMGRTEGFGAVILEAMATGLPVVASAVGGITDIVDGKNGLLVPEKDPTAIADAVEKMLADRSVGKGFADRGLTFVTTTYSDEAISEKYREFFATINAKAAR
jgi:glycosyltransferase involved in cell wall biosynthesis